MKALEWATILVVENRPQYITQDANCRFLYLLMRNGQRLPPDPSVTKAFESAVDVFATKGCPKHIPVVGPELTRYIEFAGQNQVLDKLD